MKKLFFLLSVLALATCSLVAQDIDENFVFVDENEEIVENGATVVRNLLEVNEDGLNVIYSGLSVADMGAAPNVYLKIKYNITQIDNGSYQMCFPMTCNMQTTAGMYETSPGQVNMGLQDIQCEWFPTADGTCVLTLSIETLTKSSGFPPRYEHLGYGPALTLIFVKDSSYETIKCEIGGIYYLLNPITKTATVTFRDENYNSYSGDVIIPEIINYSECDYNVTAIGNTAFASCSQLTSITLPNSITSIGDNAFIDCYELDSVVIPNSVKAIGEKAFFGCSGLIDLTIGSGVITIGNNGFNYCNSLQVLKCNSSMPPVMANSNCFSTATYNRAKLLVPRCSIEIYQTTNYWNRFALIDGWGSAGMGDVDGDGSVSISDVSVMIDTLLGVDMNSFYFESADFNNNGRLDIGDITSLIDNLLHY